MTDRPPLDALLRALTGDAGYCHLLISRAPSAQWQISLRGARTDGAYRVHVSDQPDVVEALWAAVRPPRGQSWEAEYGPELADMDLGARI